MASTRPITTNITRVGQPVRSMAKRLANQNMTGVTAAHMKALENVTSSEAKGMSGTLMPPFAKSSGGMLTDQQVAQLAQGILQAWGRPAQFAGVDLPAYANGPSGNIANGQKAFATACARCHGADGMGLKQGDKTSTTTRSSIADPNYLALVSDQTLRSFILGGRPDEAMPDWRTDIDAPSRALTSQEITDIVAWLAAHRTPAAAPIPEQHP